MPEKKTEEKKPDAPPKAEKKGRPPGTKKKVTGETVSLRVIHGSFYCLGKKYLPGDVFDCPKVDAEMFLAQGDVKRA